LLSSIANLTCSVGLLPYVRAAVSNIHVPFISHYALAKLAQVVMAAAFHPRSVLSPVQDSPTFVAIIEIYNPKTGRYICTVLGKFVIFH
jgi:hypothetical protein